MTKRACKAQCTMWFIVRDPSQTNSGKLAAARIDYGLAPLGMAVRTPAKALQLKSYSVSATVQQYDASGEFIKSLSLQRVFSLSQDASGDLGVGHGASIGAN